MAKVLVTEDYLSDIGNAIRGKLGGSTHYTPGQMASAISSIPTVDPTLISKSISANGTYNADDDNADGYDSVSVNVPNSYSVQDEGKVVSSGALVAQESQNVSQNGTYDTTLKNQVVVAVPNSYSASDEGKVVSSGELVSQTSRNISHNGTYDTTENNQVTVNVSGGGGEDDAFMVSDFTKGSFTYGNVDYGSTGAIFDNTADWIALNMPKRNDITIEIDVAMMQLVSGTHRRFVMATSDAGLIYRSNGKWAFYSGSWNESIITDGSYFDDSTVGIYIDSNNYWHIYKDGVLAYEPNMSRELSYYTNCSLLYLGSTGNSINNARITGIRVYIGNHYT